MRQEEMSEILSCIDEAEMVLVGLGEEFDNTRELRRDKTYVRGRELLEDSPQSAMLPLWQGQLRTERAEQLAREGLNNLARCLDNKNYFVVSVSVNSGITEIPWREGRLVMPCGSGVRLQCGDSCERNLRLAEPSELQVLEEQLLELRRALERGSAEALPEGLGRCPVCGNPISLNNVYNEHYDENGYLSDWQNYTKWLQGTLNRRLAVLELGVGMQFPSVIRFPFEKVAYFNQKARFYRVNENLYQMTEELAAKGVGIAKNAIDWLQNLC